VPLQVMLPASHKIEASASHYLHDELITLGMDNWITSPAHFGGHIRLTTKTGDDIETAWANLITFFSSIWTTDHRGDGLAQVLMEVQTVAQDDFANVYPQQM